uniref:Plectin/eS10 N-terminal domain-containing protein n=1 Tax=Aureoumbra lagunensis TaxID=44058 RepID=A0A7S3NL59_9STRA|mmetsp:Transcript_2473/g.3337  ORF Transcript_2473/g.3337 Transcript_2473/m.3337 type:complete len:151 (-) Transcript_2473:476-928(-)
MFIPKKNRIEVYSYLFKEGVLVAKKDNYKPKHDEIDVPNLEVLNLMKSLKSREYVRETFNWQYSYYYLTQEGIEYLREYLHLPAEIVPATLKKGATRPVAAGIAPLPPNVERLQEDGTPFATEGASGRGFGRGRGGGRGFGRGRAVEASA